MAPPQGVTRARRAAIRLVGIALGLVVWELLGRRLGEALLAPPSLVFAEYVGLLREGSMVWELLGSLRQMLVGYGLACIVGAPLGVVMGRSRAVEGLLHPWISMFVVTSVASLVPLFIVVLGTGFQFRVSIVFVASVGYPMLVAYQGARGVEPRWVEVSRSFRGSRVQLFRKVLLPALYPYLLTGARLGLVHAIRAMVVAEMFVIVGFGGLIYNTGLLVSTAPILGYLVTLMLVGLLANSSLRRVGRAIAPWYTDQAQIS
jgi:ABC-type nitrate/sulfonate/bicarbonate transport system permease component